ncbi:MAG: type II toxin-antitoxin system mRNA interferase toxin, RelE/StbE family [Nanoarchaeota archaeon]|nr:type II toxin-antitoxin system mRNA interferase toxin, RelE/StbE family [Nanoarchaeota archaeon]
MYNYEVMPDLKRTLNKLFKKNKIMYKQVMKKIEEIIQNPQHYKSLKYDLVGERRVHIMKSFVLKYEINKTRKTIIFFFFGHHDEAYKR